MIEIIKERLNRHLEVEPELRDNCIMRDVLSVLNNEGRVYASEIIDDFYGLISDVSAERDFDQNFDLLNTLYQVASIMQDSRYCT